MIALQRQQKEPLEKCSPNVLPCRIHYDGPSKVTKRFWSPSLETGKGGRGTQSRFFLHHADAAPDKTRTAYFRGRKLRGRPVNLPEGYEGELRPVASKFLRAAAHRSDSQALSQVQQAKSCAASLRSPALQFPKSQTQMAWGMKRRPNPSRSLMPLQHSTKSQCGATIKSLR